jgi:hypothetical protein
MDCCIFMNNCVLNLFLRFSYIYFLLNSKVLTIVVDIFCLESNLAEMPPSRTV